MTTLTLPRAMSILEYDISLALRHIAIAQRICEGHVSRAFAQRLPYAMVDLARGRVVVVTRDYQPAGFPRFYLEAQPDAQVQGDALSRARRAPCWTRGPDNPPHSLFLYNDECAPWLCPDSLGAYARRLRTFLDALYCAPIRNAACDTWA